MNIRLNATLIANLGSVFPQPMAEIIEATGIKSSTFYDVTKNIEKITIEQLLGIANGLHIPVRRLFSIGKTDAIGQREDYVADPYQPCSYSKQALEDFVNSHRNATWKAAGEASEMTWQGLRESLKSDRRFPISRLLAICRHFNIEPFTILLDPNPIKKGKGRRASSANSTLHAEVNMLRRAVELLNQDVDDLKGKYESLLENYEQLAKRLQVNIGTINDSHIGTIGISTDPLNKI